MKRIAVLHESPRPTWTSKRLLEAIREAGAKPLYLQPSLLSSGIGKDTCPLMLHGCCIDVDAVIVRSLGRALSLERYVRRMALLLHLEDSGVLVVNPVRSLVLARDKYTSLRIMASNGVPVPDTMLTEDPAEALRFIEKWGQAVIKPLMGSLGLGSFKVDDVDLAYRIVSMLASLGQPMYVQRYVPKKNNRDIRVFVVGDKAVAAEYRIAPPGSWKTNVARGAKTEPAKITPEMEELAVKATKSLGLLYSGVDMAETDDGNYIVFEANASPLWRGLYQATGVDPAKHIVRMVLDMLKR